MRSLLLTLFFTAVLAAGVWYLKPNAQRSRLPASITDNYDISQLSEKEFLNTSREILLNTLHIGRRANAQTQEGRQFNIQISFANFYGPKQPQGICNTYPLIEVELTGEGMAVNGQPPKLKFEVLCENTGEKVESRIVDLRGNTVESSNLDGYWIKDWYLSSFKLISEDSSIEITASDFRQVFGDVLRL